jgi:hypothetical protein
MLPEWILPEWILPEVDASATFAPLALPSSNTPVPARNSLLDKLFALHIVCIFSLRLMKAGCAPAAFRGKV